MSHDCCKPNNKNHSAKKRGIDPFVAGIGIITLVLFVGVVIFGSRIGATAQDIKADSQVELSVADNKYDWGTIDINGGIVSQTFAIENKGDSLLKLYDVSTSCMCTTAQLKTTGQTSKKFGMHEKPSSVFEVQPGETAHLIVEFDPAFHGPSGVGQISRIVNVSTNDADQPTLTFQLTANVIKP